MDSQWLAGRVRHRRLAPVRHQFDYATGMLALDVDEWHRIGRLSPLLSVERFNWLSLCRRDYFQPEAGELSAAVRTYVERATGWYPDGTVQMLTHPRYAGYVFNPVSFYFCYGAGQSPDSGAVPPVILAQITNTPWHQRHTYCLQTSGAAANRAGWRTERFRFDKRFHVSPFNDMGQQYEWTFSFRGPDLRIHMNVFEADQKRFDATLVVQRTPLTRKALHESLARFPLEAFKVVVGIYWHALRLKLKGAPFFTHPDKRAPDAPTYRLGAEDAGQDVGVNDTHSPSGGKVSSWRI